MHKTSPCPLAAFPQQPGLGGVGVWKVLGIFACRLNGWGPAGILSRVVVVELSLSEMVPGRLFFFG